MAVRRKCAQHNARHGPVSTSDRRCDQGSNHGTSHGSPSPSTLATVEYRSAAEPPRPQPRILSNGLQRPFAARWYVLHHLVQGLWRQSPYHNRAQSGKPMLYGGRSHDGAELGTLHPLKYQKSSLRFLEIPSDMCLLASRPPLKYLRSRLHFLDTLFGKDLQSPRS